MTALVKAERDGLPLTLASALVALEIDPWSFAGELAVARRSQARARLMTVLRKLRDDGPEIETIAREAIESLPQPLVEGADLPTMIRLDDRRRTAEAGGRPCRAIAATSSMLRRRFVTSRLSTKRRMSWQKNASASF